MALRNSLRKKKKSEFSDPSILNVNVFWFLFTPLWQETCFSVVNKTRHLSIYTEDTVDMSPSLLKGIVCYSVLFWQTSNYLSTQDQEMFTKQFAFFLFFSCKCLLRPHYIALKHICWRIFQKRKWSCRHYFSTQRHRYIGGCHLGPLIEILQHFLTLPLERKTNDYFHCRLIWWLSSWVIDEWFGKNRRTRSPCRGTLEEDSGDFSLSLH